MTKHLNTLIHLIALCYRVLKKTADLLEQFPLENFVKALVLFIRWAESQPTISMLDTESLVRPPVINSGNRFIVTKEGIATGIWMSKKEAAAKLGIVRSTLDIKLAENQLTKYYLKGDEHKKKPRVWLLRAEIDKHYHSYTLLKGKEK